MAQDLDGTRVRAFVRVRVCFLRARVHMFACASVCLLHVRVCACVRVCGWPGWRCAMRYCLLKL